MKEYKDNTDNVLPEKNRFIDNRIIDKLDTAGIQKTSIAPSTPAEIGCAQLYGLGQYDNNDTTRLSFVDYRTGIIPSTK